MTGTNSNVETFRAELPRAISLTHAVSGKNNAYAIKRVGVYNLSEWSNEQLLTTLVKSIEIRVRNAIQANVNVTNEEEANTAFERIVAAINSGESRRASTAKESRDPLLAIIAKLLSAQINTAALAALGLKKAPKATDKTGKASYEAEQAKALEEFAARPEVRAIAQNQLDAEKALQAQMAALVVPLAIESEGEEEQPESN